MFWVNGRILNSVGARPSERGNVVRGNTRVMYRQDQRASMQHPGWWEDVPGREPLDKLFCRKARKPQNKAAGPAIRPSAFPASTT